MMAKTGLPGRGSAAKLSAKMDVTGVLQPMDEEDLQPQSRKPDLKNLEVLSVEALEDYIGELEGEIARVRAEISKKRSARSDAESAFRK